MSINVEMTGSGELGEIATGWSVQEYATPVIIGTSSGGTGSVSFNTSSREDSLYSINNNITTTDDSLGQISGVIKSVSQTGLSVNVSHDTAISVFDVNSDVPALGAGSVYAAMDICNQVSKRQVLLTRDTGYFYSLGGHSAGFDSDGNLAYSEPLFGTYTDYNPSTGNYDVISYSGQHGNIWANSFTAIGNKLWATSVYGDNFSLDADKPKSRLALKAMLNGADLSLGWSVEPFDTNTGSGYSAGILVDYSTREISLGGEYLPGGMWTNWGQTKTIPIGIDLDEEIALFIEHTVSGSYSGYSFNVKICNTSDYTTTETIAITLDAVHAPDMKPWGITLGNVRSIYRETGLNLSANWVAEYENDETYSVTASMVIDGPVPAQKAVNLWQYLQDACAAYSAEIALVNDELIVRNVGQYVINIDNKTVPTIAANTNFSGRNVEINYTNSSNIVNGEFYNARNDSNRVLAVSSDETVVTTISVNGTPAFLSQPSHVYSLPIGVGQYHVVASNGLPVPVNMWSNYGGNVSVSVNQDTPNSIDVTLTGPSKYDGVFGPTGATYVEPYKIAYSADSADYAALSISGSGVLFAPEVLKLATAADQTKVFQDIAKSVINPFISTAEQAYDRGIFVSQEASGPKVTISLSVPVSALQGFGLTAGSLIDYRESIYRVDSASITNLSVNINASRHITVGDFDLLWNNKPVSQHDESWFGFDTSDQVITPLRYIGDDESIIMLLDTDVIPYYGFNGEPEISVFQDTDATPYYADGGNIEGEDIIKLDTDTNPYDENI